MKKIILGTVFLFLIVILVGSFVTGPVTKSMLESQIAEINKMPGYRAELTEYNAGWRKADGKIEIGFDWDFYTSLSANDLTPEQKARLAAVPSHLVLDLQVAHGPILTNNGIGLGLSFIQLKPNVSDNARLKSFQERAKVNELFTYQMVIGLLGGSSFSLDSPPLQIADDSTSSRFSYGGTHFEGSYNARSKAFIAEGALQPLTFALEGSSFEMAATELDADLVLLNQAVSLGDMEIKIAKFTGVGPEQGGVSELSMADLLIRYEGEKDSDETVKMAVQYGIGEMVVGDQRLSDMNFQVAFERLGIEALQQYYDQLINLYENAEDTSAVQQQLAAMSELGSVFLKYSPAVDIPDVSFVINDGKFSANTRVDFDGQGADITPADLANPLILMARLKVVGALNVDQQMLDTLGVKMLADQISAQLASQNQQMSEDEIHELAQTQLQGMLAQQVQQGILEATVDGYRAAFSMDKGAMKLNGQPFSPF